MPTLLERRLFFLLIAVMAWSTAMLIEAAGIASPDFKAAPDCYFSGKPIVDVELSPTPVCFQSIVIQGADEGHQHNVQLVRANTYMDFVFIALYLLVFVMFARIEGGWPAKPVILLISLSALADVIENIQIFMGLRALESSTPLQFQTPFRISMVKWALLGLVFLLLAIAVWLRKGRWYMLLAVALVAAGILTLLGLAIPKAMIGAGYAFLFVFFLLLARLWWFSFATVLSWIEYGYLLRFQILAGAILAMALPLAYAFVPSLFVGAFDALGFTSFLLIVWVAFQLAWTVMVCTRLVLVYGPARFARANFQPSRVTTGIVAAFGLLAVPLVVLLFIGSDRPPGAGKVLAAVLGLCFAIGVLALTASLHFAIEDPEGHSAESIFPSFGFLQKKSTPKTRFWTVIESWLARLPEDLKPGIVDNGRLHSGHEMATMALAVFFGIYLVLGLVFSPAWATPERQPAALFFLLVLLTILTWLFSGAAFFLDRTRLPVLTSLLLVSLLTGAIKTDHEYAVKHSKAPIPGGLQPADVIDKWKMNRGKKSDTVLVVATAGGGIRAAAWTAQVMTRLQLDCHQVADSLVLVSSVSGGSVGSMFVLGQYNGDGTYPTTEEQLQRVRFNAQRSSLSAVGWGLAYPDLWRTAPILGSLFVPQKLDRGWSLENAWATAWRDAKVPTPTMALWRQDVQEGKRPAAIFNATASESGQRFLIASTDGKFEGASNFFDLFQGKDLAVPTAARLSATFPYASPLARASKGVLKNGYHVGDGGYYDNSGLLSVVEWLRQTGASLTGHNVILILIDAKPGAAKPGTKWPWQKQLIGPVETLLNVRSSSQQTRESIELKMAKKYLANADPNAVPAEVSITVIPEFFLFSSDSDSAPPLSWHLTKAQRKELVKAWDKDNQTSWKEVRSKLGCSCDVNLLKEALKAEEKDEDE